MQKYFTHHLTKVFQSIRREARERFRLSFHRAYVLSFCLIIILGILYVWILNSSANSGYQMTTIEGIRREKQEAKNLLRAQIARQESRRELQEHDDDTVPISKDLQFFITFDDNAGDS